MPSFNPSDQLFTTRVRALAERDGVQGIADFYGVQRRTARRWLAGGQPRSLDTQRSVVRRARPLTGAVVQGPGQFSTRNTIYRRDAITFFRRQQQLRRDRQTAAIANASTPEQFAMADAMLTDITIEEARAFESEMLRRRDFLVQGEFEEYFGYEDSWDNWRSDYYQMRG